ITRMIKVKHVGVDDMAAVLQKFKPKEADISVYPPTNTLIVTDVASNIQRLVGIIRQLDIERGSERIWVERVYHALASELADKLLLVLEQRPQTPGARPGTPPVTGAKPGTPGAAGHAPLSMVGGGAFGETQITKIIPDDRTQQLLIVANELAYLRVHELL